MTPHDQIARGIAEQCWLDDVQRSHLAGLIAAALARAHDDALEEAAKKMDQLGDKDWNDDLVNEPIDVACGMENICREGATAIRSLKGNNKS